MAGRLPKYPWKEWMDGEEHTIIGGVDFHCTRKAMRNQLHQHSLDSEYRCDSWLVEDQYHRQGLAFKYELRDPAKAQRDFIDGLDLSKLVPAEPLSARTGIWEPIVHLGPPESPVEPSDPDTVSEPEGQ